jgi:hypothetical protein
MIAWIGVAMGALQLITGAVQGIKGQQEKKAAEKAMKSYSNRLQGLPETNMLRGLSVPDISSLKFQENMQAVFGATEAMKGMGPEGAAQIANLNQSVLQDQAQTAQDQAKLMYDRDLTVAGEDSRIQEDKTKRQADLLKMQITGAGMAQAQGQNKSAAGFTSAFEGLGSGLESGMSTEGYQQWFNANQG